MVAQSVGGAVDFGFEGLLDGGEEVGDENGTAAITDVPEQGAGPEA
jgi:hypothetical protein